jgi:hypothetical protein
MRPSSPRPVGARRIAFVLLALAAAWPASGRADVTRDRFSAAGYFRVMVRPDLAGGTNRLGFWNLYGRLMNEGPYAMLDLKLDMLQASPGSDDTWASVYARIEGGSIKGADITNGNLGMFGLTQLYVKAGNVLLRNVTWQVGTLWYYFGDLGLYDMRPADVFFNTLGLSATYHHEKFDWLVGIGDSGYPIRGTNYDTILTVGTALRLRPVKHLEFGVGGEFLYEPGVAGNRFGPHQTPLPDGITYEDFFRKQVAEHYSTLFPGQEDQFPQPKPVAATSYKLVGYVGFGNLGPLRWNSIFANFIRRHPDNFYTEAFGGRDYTIYDKSLTDQRYQATLGNEMQLRLWPNRLDLVWAVLFGWRRDYDNKLTGAPSEDNEIFVSGVLRLQAYLTRTLHWLGETSMAQERSLKGNLWRAHYDSVFQSQGGLANTTGLEFGDLSRRNTWQLKTGFVINPAGYGIFTRPSLRVLYGVQYSNMHDAFGNSFVQTLDQFNQFHETSDRHWHHVVGLEAEAWF